MTRCFLHLHPPHRMKTGTLCGLLLLLTYLKSLEDASHVAFVFDKPLSNLATKQDPGWLGAWISEQGRELLYAVCGALSEENQRQDPSVLPCYITPKSLHEKT